MTRGVEGGKVTIQGLLIHRSRHPPASSWGALGMPRQHARPADGGMGRHDWPSFHGRRLHQSKTQAMGGQTTGNSSGEGEGSESVAGGRKPREQKIDQLPTLP